MNRQTSSVKGYAAGVAFQAGQHCDALLHCDVAMKVTCYLACAGLALIMGCQSYPMGLSQAQWDSLTPEQQAEYRSRQTEMNAQRQREQAAIDLEQQRLREQQERETRARTKAAYARARYGDIITVTIQGGRVAINGKHQPYEPLKFDIVRGETKQVEFAQIGRPSAKAIVTVRLSEDGNTFFFDERARDRVKLLNEGWEKGPGRTYGSIEIRDTASQSMAHDVQITLRVKPLGGR